MQELSRVGILFAVDMVGVPMHSLLRTENIKQFASRGRFSEVNIMADIERLLTAPVIDTMLCNYAINFSAEDMVQICKVVEAQRDLTNEEWVEMMDDCMMPLSHKTPGLVQFVMSKSKWHALRGGK